MRKIRRNLREYQDYWFWGIYNLLWCRRLDRTPDIMTELRLLTDDIFRYCPRLVHDIAIGKMAEMEDDEHIDQFLDTYASAEDLSRPTLQLNRYRARGEWDKHEPVRMFHLWFTIVNLVDTPKNWMKSAEKDPAYTVWYTKTNLAYLNSFCSIPPNPLHPVSGNGSVDLWCIPRVMTGFRLSAALADLGSTEEALIVLNDTVSLLEAVMAIKEDEFKLTCTSPAMEGFHLDARFHWMDEKDSLQHRQLCCETNGWNNWLLPVEYLTDAYNWGLQKHLENDPRFFPFYQRMQACVITRQKQDESR